MLWFNETTVSKPYTLSPPTPPLLNSNQFDSLEKAKGYSDAIWDLRKTKKVDN